MPLLSTYFIKLTSLQLQLNYPELLNFPRMHTWNGLKKKLQLTMGHSQVISELGQVNGIVREGSP